jgi:hypothetical protein
MNAPSDDDLRRRMQELGGREAGTAPSFARVVAGRAPEAAPPESRWLTGLFAMAGIVALVVALAGQWSGVPRGEPSPVSVAGASPDPAADWALPTDALLAEVGESEVERLTREIEGLLRP